VPLLTPDQLYARSDPASIPYATSDEAPDLEGLVGQDRAVDAILFAIAIRRPGYNLYVLGPSGSGKHSLVNDLLRRRAEQDCVPDDWCYVHNFETPNRPRALRLPPGRAVTFSDSMKRLVVELRASLPAAFESDEYRARREVVDEQYKQRHEAAFVDLQRRAEADGVGIVRTPSGMAVAPARDGEVVPPEEFRKLPEEEQERLKQLLERYQGELEQLVRKIPELERAHREEVTTLNRELTRYAIGHLIEEVRAGFRDLPAVQAYLDAVERDLMDTAHEFLPQPQPQGPEAAMMGMLAGQAGGGDPPSARRYQVNVMVDNGGRAGAPVIYEDHPTHQSLVGRIEHLARFGALITDFNLLRPGALHRANGGYLILDAERLFQSNYTWESLKRALSAEAVKLETLETMLSVSSTVTVEPEPIPLDVKVVLIGDPQLYYVLGAYDSDFEKLFKIAAEFDDRIQRHDGHTALFARLIATVARRIEVRPVDRGGLARIIEHAARLAEDAERLSLQLRRLSDLLAEADHFAAATGQAVIDAHAVQLALDAQVRRADRVYLRIVEEIRRGTYRIDTAGDHVGQINGLVVQGLGGFVFGHPTRITARVSLGSGEVLDIEREVDLGGPLHSKGVLILGGFLGGRFGRERVLSVSATLVFEQSYGGIDGDSASSAELYALLSALSDVPIRQSLAVTGSIDQYGNVQPIGGVNEKIEGFFDVCRARGLTGDQGVLVPAANVKHLMLREDVVEAVRAGQFRIWGVETVDEGIEILTGVPAGVPTRTGHYPHGTINHFVDQRLERLAAKQRERWRPRFLKAKDDDAKH